MIIQQRSGKENKEVGILSRNLRFLSAIFIMVFGALFGALPARAIEINDGGCNVGSCDIPHLGTNVPVTFPMPNGRGESPGWAVFSKELPHTASVCFGNGNVDGAVGLYTSQIGTVWVYLQCNDSNSYYDTVYRQTQADGNDQAEMLSGWGYLSVGPGYYATRDAASYTIDSAVGNWLEANNFEACNGLCGEGVIVVRNVHKCPAGYYCPGAGPFVLSLYNDTPIYGQIKCPDGTYSEPGATSVNDCVPYEVAEDGNHQYLATCDYTHDKMDSEISCKEGLVRSCDCRVADDGTSQNVLGECFAEELNDGNGNSRCYINGVHITDSNYRAYCRPSTREEDGRAENDNLNSEFIVCEGRLGAASGAQRYYIEYDLDGGVWPSDDTTGVTSYIDDGSGNCNDEDKIYLGQPYRANCNFEYWVNTRDADEPFNGTTDPAQNQYFCPGDFQGVSVRAKWTCDTGLTSSVRECQPGEFLPAGEDSCVSCRPDGSGVYCPGGVFGAIGDGGYTKAQGRFECAIGSYEDADSLGDTGGVKQCAVCGDGMTTANVGAPGNRACESCTNSRGVATWSAPVWNDNNYVNNLCQISSCRAGYKSIAGDGVEGLCSIITYGITYNLNGGKNPSGTRTSYNVESSTYTLPTPTKVGHTFGGWYTNSGLTGNAVTQITKGSTGNKTFYAKWTANGVTCAAGKYLPKNSTTCATCPAGYYCPGGTYTSSTSDQGLNACPEFNVSSASLVDSSASWIDSGAPDIEGITSKSGCLIDAAYGSVHGYWIERRGMSSDSATSYDKLINKWYFEIVPNSGYYLSGPTTTCLDSLGIGPGQGIGYSNLVKCEAGYYCTGGNSYNNTAVTCGGTNNPQIIGRTQCPTGTTSAAGASSASACTAATYKVTLDKQGGTGGTSEYYYQYNTKGKCYYYTTSALSTCIDSSDGQHITVPTRTGYTFGGYYTGKNGTGTQYVNASGLAINNLYKTVGNRTLYAKWTPKTWYVEFDDALSSATCGDFIGVATLEYNNQDYSGNQPDGCDWYGDDGYPHMPMPETRSGYTFAGWYTGVNGTGTQLTDENGRILDSVYTTDFGDDGATITAYAKWVSNGTPTFTVTVKTTDANTVFSFKLAAAGTFHVDWGDGSTVQTINRTNTTQTTYSHTFATAGTYTVGFAGRATAYVTQPTLSDSACTGNAGSSACNNSIPAFTLSGMGKYIYGMSGSIGSIFPTLASGAQPGFRSAFSSIQATSIPENLFSGITGTPTTCMFTGTFYGAKITSIPENLFHGITGTAPALFAGTFWATKITSIPAGLFSTITGTLQPYMFEATFTDTTALTSIPAGLFGGVTGAPARCAFKDAFRSTGAKSLPANLFPNLSGKPGYYSLKNMFALANTLSGYVPASMFTNLDSTNYSRGPMDSIFVQTALATSCPAGKYQYLTGFESDWSSRVACSDCPQTPYTDSGTDTENITNGTRSRTKTRSCYKTSVAGNKGGIAACDATTSCGAYTYGDWTYTCNTGYHLSGTTCVANTYTIKYQSGVNGATVSGTMPDTTCTYDQDCKLAPNGFSIAAAWKFVGWGRQLFLTDAEYANGATVRNLTSVNGGTVYLYGIWEDCPACNATNANCTLTAPLGVCTYATSCKTGYGNIQNNGKYNASCSANTYTITLRDYADANTHSTIYQVYGSKYYSDTSTKAAITKAAVPSRSGYKFRGFYTAKQSDLTANGGSGTRRITSDGTLPGNTTFTANTKLYAAWAKDCTTPANGTCSLTINANGTATYTASCNSGYTVSGATTATPSCTANTYTVTYAANGGTGSNQTQSVTYKSSFTTKASNTFTRSGYTFAGWGGSYPKSNTAYTYTTTGNTTLNAQWCHNCASVSNGSCKLTVNEATGACTYATSCNAGYTISNNGKYNPTCTANTYTVTYAANGGTGSNQTQSVTYKSSFTTKASNTFTRNGYTFAGWGGSYPKSNTAYTYTTTGNTTLNAQWCQNCASVSNGSCKLTVNEATGACTYATSCNAGYTISNNGKYNPTCTANTYTVSFNVNGGTGGQSASVTATYGAAMPAISTTAPTKTGYTFGGWYDTSAATGGTQYYTAAGASARSWNKTANTTLYARWTIKSITCAAGKYLPANKDTCATCVAGYSCAGGTWTYDGSEHGRTQCTGATYAGSGAASCTSCPSPYTYDKSAGKTKIEQCTVQTSAGYYIKTANGGEENCPYGYYCPGTVVAYGSTGGATACPDGVQNKPSKWPDNYHDVTRVSMDDSFSMGNSRKTIDECVFAYDLENSRGTIFAVHRYNSQTGKYDIQVQDGFWMWYKSLKSGYYLGKKWTYNGQDWCQVNGNGESKLYQDALPCPTDAYCPGYNGTIESSGWPKCGDGVYAAETGYCPAIASHTVDTWSAMYRNPTIVETQFSLDGGAADGSTFMDTGGETGPCMAKYLLKNDAGTIFTMRPYSAQTGKYEFYFDDAETLNFYKDYYTWYVSLNPGYYFTKRWSRTQNGETITMCDHAEASSPRIYVEAEPCPAGSYCPGYDETLDMFAETPVIPDSWPKCGDTAPYTDIYNKYACPTTYPNSAAKSSKIEQCYLTTTAGKYVATARADQVQCLANNYCTGGTQVNYGSTGGMQSCATGYESAAGASSCTATTYSITYNLNGGTNASSNPAKYTVETATITLAAPTKTGYTFGGWYTNSGLTGNAVTQIAKGSTGNKTFWAKWTVKSVTCAAGKYLPANSLSCGDCTAGYACPGGTYSYSSSIQGRTQCTGATYSGAGAATCATCPSIYTSDTTAGKTKITDCKVKTTAGKYIANANDSTQTACTTGHYCPSETVAYGSTNTPTACPTADATTARTTYPTDYLNPTMLTIKNQTWSTGWAKKSQCSANYTFTNVAGNFTVESVQFNETTGKYDNGGGKYYTKVNGGYYLVDQYSSTYCNVASRRMLYHNVAECPAGSYCPGYASMPLCSSGTYETTMGLYTCPTTYPNSAAKSSAETQCYLTTTAGKYVATAKADQVACTAGYKCPGNITVYYGSTGGRTQCTGATYAGAGASACTACPSGYTTNTDNGKTAATQCTISVAAGKYLGTKNETTVSTCAAGTYKAAHTVNYGSTSSCSACTGRTKYSAAGAASCSNVSTGYYTTGCNTSGNNCTGQKQCTSGTWCASGVMNQCSSLSGVSVSGGTYSSAVGSTANTACKYTGPSKTLSGCKTVTTNTVTYSGTAWPTTTYSVTANGGYIISNNNQATAACTQCNGAVYSAGGTATSCAACPSAESGWTQNTGAGWSKVEQCNQTKTVGGYCSAGQLKKNATSDGTWPTAATTSVAIQAKAGSIVSGQTCTQCSGAKYSAGGTATQCTSCPTATSGWTRNTGTGWSKAEQCNQTKTVGGNCAAGQLKQNATSSTAWGASTISIALSAKPGAFVNGQTCSQCNGALYSAGGTVTSCSSCPTATSGWTISSGIGWTKVEQCNQTKNVGGYCSAGTLIQNATSATAWGASEIMTELQAKPGSIVSGQTCTQCTGAKYSAGGTATSCASCPAATSGWTQGTGTGWSAVTSCYQTKAATSVSTYCASGQLKQNATSGTAWGDSTISTALTAKPGAIVDGQTCSQCTGATYSGGGAVTQCTVCPTLYDANVTAGKTAEPQCQIKCAAKTVVNISKGACDALTTGGYYKGEHLVNYGSTSSAEQCPAGYRDGAVGAVITDCAKSVAGGNYVKTANDANVTQCVAGTYRAAHTVKYGSTSSCDSCMGRTKYSAAGASACSTVSTGYYTTGCNTNNNNCTGQSQCNGSVYCTGGILNNCPTAESGWTAGTGKGWSAVTSCFETKAATSVSTYCSAGQLKKNATNGTTWGASTISTALTAKPGAIVNGQTCTQCIGSTYSAGGTATLCELCPDGYTNDISNGKTSASQCAISVNGGHYIGTAGQNSTNWGTCAAGTYKDIHLVYYGNTSSCSACTGRTKYSAAGASACSTVSSGYYTTGCTGDDKCTGQTQCTSGTWCASGVMKQCSSLSGVSVAGGTYSSAVGSTANTACKYTGPSKTLNGCKTVTTNTVAYSGTAWPTTTYSVTANGGYIISNNNQAAAACTQCNGAVYSAGGTATSCAACPSAESGWTAGTGKGWSAVTSCFETKAATSVSTYCSAGQLKKNATNGTTWGASTISVPLQAKAGSIVNGQTCEQCSGAKYSAGGTVTNCASCPTADTGWTLGTGTGWTSYSACYEYQTPANCASGSVKRTATSATAYSTTIALLNKLSSKAGYYASATATSCTICPKGSSCAAGAVNPTACANWSYADKTGMSSCTSCPTVTSGWNKSNTTGTGWTSYTQCQQTTGAPEHCVSGGLKQTATSSTAWGASTVNAALSAQAGYYVNGIACSICTGATYSGGGTLTKCDECPTIYTHNTTDGKIRIDQCQAKTTAGKYIKTKNDDMETVCAAGGYCAGGTIVNWGGIGGRTLCTAGTYNPNTGSSLATACVKSDAGYYVDTNGATAQTACTGATYTDAAGATKCTTCPTATKYADALARYSYYNTGAIGDHTTKTKCQAIFNSTIDHGTLVNDACYLGSDNDYGTSTSNGASTCWLLKDGLSCDGGYYNKSQSASTRATVLSNACIAVGAGYWSATGGLTRTQCGSGLTTIGYGAGADEAGDCGRILHAGNHTIYLRNTKKTTPSLNVDINGTVFYGNMTQGTTYGKFRVNKGGTVYSVHNDATESIERPIVQGQVSMSGSFTNTTKRLRTDYIPVEPNTQYTVTYTSTATPNLIYATYDANKSMLSRANSKRTGFTFTTETNAKYVAFTWYGNDSATVTPSDVQNFRLEQW